MGAGWAMGGFGARACGLGGGGFFLWRDVFANVGWRWDFFCGGCGWARGRRWDFFVAGVVGRVGGDKPRKAGANALRYLFDKFLKGTFRIMEKRQSSCSPNGANAANRI